MKLDSIRIRNYRCAHDVLLSDIGNFNVLIGKNNSGKSTILFAVHAFFRCIAGSAVVSANPPLGRPIDFFLDSSDEPIRISLTFSMELAERDVLIRDIATEAPQVKNAVDGLDPSMKLVVTISVPRQPGRYSYIEEVSLVDSVSLKSRPILKVPQTAAMELVRKLQSSRDLKNTAEQLKRASEDIDADDFRRMTTREGPEGRGLTSYRLRRLDASPATANLLENLLNSAQTFPEFRSHLSAEVEKYTVEEQKVLQTPLKNTLETFSGDQDHVPQYAMNLLGALSETSVLYLTEKRAPIGRTEAEKVLAFKVRRGGH